MSNLDSTETSLNTQVPIGEHIGICMSGGGYRAAAFHLGTLDYLERLEAIDKLSSMSSVSGGTFTTTKFVISRAEGKSYIDFFKDFYDGLSHIDLLNLGLKELASKQNKVPSGRQDLIVSMAQVYSETFFCKKDASGQAQPYYFDTVLNGNCNLDDVMLNATDFRSGFAFRFQRSLDNRGKIGNKYNNISHQDAAKIRLADIVAASSCFPGGFEPLSFPYDFSWEEDNIPPAVTKAFPSKNTTGDAANPQGPVPLMDGGVYDNQGLQSLLLADKRNHYSLDLVIISDVTQPSIELYEMPAPGNNGGLSLGMLNKLSIVFFLLCIASLVTISSYAYIDFSKGILSWSRGLFLYAIPFSLTAIAAFTVFRIRTVVKEDVLPHVPVIGDRAWSSLKLITTGQLRNMVKLRISSLLALTSSVFMKRIRALVYDLFYGKGKEVYDGKRVSNLIYSLSPLKRKDDSQLISTISPILNKVACAAYNQPTTLWFDKNYQQASLVASGQATLCYNMLKLFLKKHGEQTENYPKDVKAVWDKLISDWRSFNDDPFFLLSQRIEVDKLALIKEINELKCDWGMFETQ